MPLSLGVNVTDCCVVPTDGAVLGVVNAKLPAMLDTPPLKVESASVWPKAIDVAVGDVVIVGVALPTVTLTFVVTVV